MGSGFYEVILTDMDNIYRNKNKEANSLIKLEERGTVIFTDDEKTFLKHQTHGHCFFSQYPRVRKRRQ